jgi:hypothetical protein
MWGITQANALAELTKFIVVQGIPGGFVAGISSKLVML